MIDFLSESRHAAALAARPAPFPGPYRGAGLGPFALLGRFYNLMTCWSERARQRHLLEGLSDHALRDIGISRADVAGECDKPFWRG